MKDDGSRDVLDPVLRDISSARNYNGWLFDRARPYLGRDVLDVGAGIGTFTRLAADAGAFVTAVDPEFATALRARFAGDLRVQVVEGAADDVPSDRRFDSILCFNVLEHIEEHEAMLRSLSQRLRPGGRLLLLVPAHAYLYGGFDRAAGHVRRYDKPTLHKLLQRADLVVEDVRHVNPVGALGWLVRMRTRRTPDWPSSSFHVFDRLVPLLRPLDRLRLPCGLSLWAVARRPA